MANIDKIRLSGTTYDIVDSGAIHSLDGYWTSGQTESAITAATSALAETIAEQGYQTSGDVQNAISGKADSNVALKLVAPIAYSSGDTSGNNGALNLRYIRCDDSSSTVQNALEAKDGLYITRNSTSGAAIYVDFTTVAQKSDVPSVSGYADAVAYNATSKYVEFYHGGTGGTVVFSYDASPFLIDGMVQNVEIKDVTISGESVTCLVISFNTDAGKQDINIPLTEIFDASNYYTTGETDSAIAAATSGKVNTTDFNTYSGNVETALSGKQDTLTAGTGIDITDNVVSVTGVPLTVDDTVTSGSNNPVKSSGIYNFVTGETSTKQDTLVSGTNIKTVGTESVLGSGNIKLMTAHIGTGDDSTTLIFDFA